MLAAAVEDCRRAAGVEVLTLLDERRRPEAEGRWPDVAVTWVEPGGEPDAFRSAAAAADFALVIAPEFDRLLETRCRWAEAAGCRLLGPPPDAVALTADKLALFRHLDRASVPTPETMPAMQSVVGFPPRPWVVKPRYGAGSQETYLVTLTGTLTLNPLATGPLGEMIVQPYVPGQPASVAFLIGPRQTIALAPAAQHLSDDGHFHYLGGQAPLPEPLAGRAVRVARRAVDAVPGLGGYVGVDVVLGEAADGTGDRVIEINPRLTTSYVGLRALAADNLMELLLRVARGEPTAEPRWRPGVVSWTADGHTTPV
jgi:predicted ATP-grasp superfamily ATP-dependent carboligase